MAKPLKVWNGSAWVDVTVSMPSIYVTFTDLNSHISDTTNIHGIADTSVLVTNSSVSATIDNEELLIISGAL